MTTRSGLLRAFSMGLLILFAMVGLYVLIAPAGASAQGAGGPGAVVVLCSSCAFAGMPREGHLVMMDSHTGDIWAYSDAAMAGMGQPTYVGTLKTLGQAVSKTK